MKNIIAILVLTIFISCGNPKKMKLEDEAVVSVELSEDVVNQDTVLIEDEVYDDGKRLWSTARFEGAKSYFKKNNRYKDWDRNDEKMAIVQAISEKDGRVTDLSINKSSGVDKLDEEAIRLIKDIMLIPALNMDMDTVRSRFVIAVFFPPRN